MRNTISYSMHDSCEVNLRSDLDQLGRARD
jgi:hypothetical protein